MNLSTRSFGERTRRVERITNKPIGVCYVLIFNRPALRFSNVGQNGVSYTIELDDNDLKAIAEARQKYSDHFK